MEVDHWIWAEQTWKRYIPGFPAWSERNESMWAWDCGWWTNGKEWRRFRNYEWRGWTSKGKDRKVKRSDGRSILSLLNHWRNGRLPSKRRDPSSVLRCFVHFNERFFPRTESVTSKDVSMPMEICRHSNRTSVIFIDKNSASIPYSSWKEFHHVLEEPSFPTTKCRSTIKRIKKEKCQDREAFDQREAKRAHWHRQQWSEGFVRWSEKTIGTRVSWANQVEVFNWMSIKGKDSSARIGFVRKIR